MELLAGPRLHLGEDWIGGVQNSRRAIGGRPCIVRFEGLYVYPLSSESPNHCFFFGRFNAYDGSTRGLQARVYRWRLREVLDI